MTLRTALRCLLAALLLSGAPSLHAADAKTEVEATVNTFLKDYLSKGYREYFKKSPLVTPKAKAALKAMETKAEKENPELGLDYDPVVVGQDHADKYTAKNVVIKGATATAQATAPEWTAISVRLVKVKDAWLIDGIGDVNK